MTTTLLEIAQAGCNYIGVAAPTAIVGNTSDETAIRCLAAANAAGNAVTRRAPGGWVSMIREYDFATVASGLIDGTVTNVSNQAVVTILTADLDGLVPTTTAWLVSGTNLLNNSVITEINTVGASTAYTLNLPASQTGAGSFYFAQSDYAAPSDMQRAIDGTFWDRTRYWQMRGALSPQQWQSYRSSIYGKATIEARWRFRNSDWLSSATGTPAVNILSLDPIPQAPARQMVFEYVSTGWCANASTGARQTQWLADTDYSVVDPYLVQLDFTWRLLRRFGLAYNEELAEYEREVDKAAARDGSTMLLSLTPTFGIGLLSPYNIQDGFWPGNIMNS